jgi:hypothetical protein
MLRPRTKALVGVVLAVGVLVTASVGSTPASAAHYYGTAELQGTNFGGLDVSLRSGAMSVPNYRTDFVDNEAWVINDYFPTVMWVEGGIILGYFSSNPTGGSYDVRQPTFFWADNRPCCGFYSHIGGRASLNTNYDDNIQRTGYGQWTVKVGGLTGVSSPTFDQATTRIETGTEETTQSAVECAGQSYLAWYDQNGGYHQNWWTGSYGNASVHDNNPPFIYWVSQNQWLRDYSNIGC